MSEASWDAWPVEGGGSVPAIAVRTALLDREWLGSLARRLSGWGVQAFSGGGRRREPWERGRRRYVAGRLSVPEGATGLVSFFPWRGLGLTAIRVIASAPAAPGIFTVTALLAGLDNFLRGEVPVGLPSETSLPAATLGFCRPGGAISACVRNDGASRELSVALACCLWRLRPSALRPSSRGERTR